MADVKFLFASDLHGSETTLNKVINSAAFYKVPNILIGGDLTGKLLVPIIKNSDGTYVYNQFGETRNITEEELKEVEDQLRLSGFYYRIVTPAEYEELESSKEEQRRYFIEEMKAHIDRFFKKAVERLAPAGVRMYLIPGNDDYQEVADYVKEYAPECVIPCDKENVFFGDDYQLVGYGYSNKTPWNTPRELDEDTIYSDISKLMNRSDCDRTILMAHVPPFQTIIDKAPQLTEDMKPVINGGDFKMVSVGSTAVRKIIEDYRPMLGLHGHIHESAGIDYIRNKKEHYSVPVFNPGSEYSYGILKGVLIQLKESKVNSFIFTKG